MLMTQTLRSSRPADADLARQCQIVRDVAAAVRADRDLPQAASLESIEDALAEPSGPCQAFFDPDAMADRLAWARGLKDDSGKTVQAALKRASELGPMRRVASPPDVQELNELERDFPHGADVLAFVRKRAVLCSIVPGGAMQLPPILLHGPPGTGKTAISGRLAHWLHVPIVQLDMATVETAFKVNGLDSGYASGKPGLIWDALDQACMSPVIVLDEIDKCAASHRQDGLGWLLGLLEPSTAARYRDSCLGLPVNASCIQWIATCNDLDALEAPLLSRFRVFEVPVPDHEQMRAVAISVWRQMRNMQPWAAAFEVELSDAVLEALMRRTPREIRQTLEDACANAGTDGRRHLTVEDLPPQRMGTRRAVGFLG